MKDLQIELTVLKYFVRALKLRNMYHFFYRALTPAFGFMYRNKSSIKAMSDSPFRGCKTITDVATKIAQLNKAMNGHGHHMPMPGMDERAEVVTMCTNHLIHFFVEANVRDMNVLNAIGQDTFNCAIAELYGNDVLDSANAAMDAAQNSMSSPEACREMLWRMYLDLSSRHQITCSFDEFVQSMSDRMAQMQMEEVPAGNCVDVDENYYMDTDRESDELYEDDEYYADDDDEFED